MVVVYPSSLVPFLSTSLPVWTFTYSGLVLFFLLLLVVVESPTFRLLFTSTQYPVT